MLRRRLEGKWLELQSKLGTQAQACRRTLQGQVVGCHETKGLPHGIISAEKGYVVQTRSVVQFRLVAMLGGSRLGSN